MLGTDMVNRTEAFFGLGRGCRGLTSCRHAACLHEQKRQLVEAGIVSDNVKVRTPSEAYRKGDGLHMLGRPHNLSSLPHSRAAQNLLELRQSLGELAVPWYSNAARGSLQLAVHIRRGDLSLAASSKRSELNSFSVGRLVFTKQAR
jgi:hypothetical protein